MFFNILDVMICLAKGTHNFESNPTTYVEWRDRLMYVYDLGGEECKV